MSLYVLEVFSKGSFGAITFDNQSSKEVILSVSLISIKKKKKLSPEKLI